MNISTDFRSNPLRRAFWENSWIMGCILAFSLAAALLQLTVPLFMLLIYDRVVPARSQETLVSLMVLALMLLALMAILDFARRRLLARFGAKIQEKVEDAATVVTSHGTPKINSKEVQLLDEIRSFFHSSSAVALIDILWMPIFIGAVFILHPWFGWTAILGIITLVLTFSLGAALSSYRKREATTARKHVVDLVASSKRSKDVIAHQRLSTAIHRRWKDARASSRIAAILARDRTSAVGSILGMSRTMFTVLILFIGATLVLQAKITMGAMVAGVVLLNRVFTPVVNFLNEFPSILAARGKWQALEATFDAAKNAKPVAQTGVPRNGELKVEQVVLADNREKVAILRDLNFSVPPGSLVEITGPSGSGKSLLVMALLGLRPVRKGSIQIGGVDLRHAGAESLSGKFGLMSQNLRFIKGTIAENIASFRNDMDLEAVLRAAQNARAHELIQALPLGYQTMLDDIGSQFSQGQLQLIGLARALYGEPQILILDEPGSILEEAFDKTLGGSISAFLESGNSILIFGRRPYRLPKSARRYKIRNETLIAPLTVGDHQTSKSILPKLVKPAS